MIQIQEQLKLVIIDYLNKIKCLCMFKEGLNMKCNKCGCLVDEYYHSYKYDDLDYCHHCMLETLVDLGIIKITSYNEEYKRFLESLNSIE